MADETKYILGRAAEELMKGDAVVRVSSGEPSGSKLVVDWVQIGNVLRTVNYSEVIAAEESKKIHECQEKMSQYLSELAERMFSQVLYGPPRPAQERLRGTKEGETELEPGIYFSEG